ncbi:ATP-binding protein [Bacteroides difficilis]|uniref:ATP-binding response regulator n=1 Tax=Bacteroides difficilis TaxID=2763021 RepID=UPI003AAB72D0
MWLRFKIFLGYTILMVLLVCTIVLFRREQIKRGSLHQDERELVHIRNLSQQAYAGLLELATYGETVSVWNEDDLKTYQANRYNVRGTLQELKRYVNTHRQQACIDSLCLLLERKEQLLDTIMGTFKHFWEVNEIVRRKIPLIASRVHRDTESLSDEKEEGKNAQKSFWTFLRRKKKSAYREQKESMGRRQDIPAATRMLHSLNREVTDKQTAEQKKLLVQMDSLYAGNVALNRRLHGVVKDFEMEASRRLEERYKHFLSARDRSFRTASILGIIVSLLTIILYIVVHRDINRRNRYQRQLEVSNKENKELIQSRKRMMLTIAHDLRSPLAIIRGTAELLPGEQERVMQEEYAGNIRHASDYMLSLVDTLMNFYLLDTGQAWENVSIFHLESLFREIADSYMPSAKKKELQLLTRFSGMNAVVSCDKGHLQQIVNNLLSNALKFTGKGHVLLEAMFHKGELCIKVQDTGTGMDNNEQKRIFDAFERLDNARNIPGFGLGLAITSRLVSQMGGSIRVESRPGEGSCFIVSLPLPLADSKSLAKEQRLTADYEIEGTRILLLDDDPRLLSILCEMFRRNRAECDCCTDCREVVKRLREHDYDVLLTDIRMPDMDGFELLALLRSSNMEKARTIPVIAMTADVDPEDMYLSGGFAGCIRKPFRMDDLMETVAQIAGKSVQLTWQPDFSLIFSDEDDREGMLGVFILESRKDLDRLHEALRKDDRQAIREILHKNLPLWISVRLDYPVEEVQGIILSEPEFWTEKQMSSIHTIEIAAGKLITYAEHMKKKISQEDEKHINYRG